MKARVFIMHLNGNMRTRPSILQKMAKDSVDEYKTWLKVKAKVEGDGEGGGIDLFLLKKALNSTRKSDSILRKALKKDTFTGNDLDTLNATDPVVKAARGGMLYMFRAQQMMETSNVEFYRDLVNL